MTFLSQFISLLSRYLEADAQIVHNSTGNADMMIAACGLQFTIQGSGVNVVADDMDACPFDLLLEIELDWYPIICCHIWWQAIRFLEQFIVR